MVEIVVESLLVDVVEIVMAKATVNEMEMVLEIVVTSV